ncbi:unnamed protein product [Cylindrotheca closterium]|uniref:Uncharacterized protein n=1 Tax=Cylindrotheca closterium TaxID=2856 RepID=A0AAD2PWP5_9STRA|nr:unnamed protein product [Cylindrotheca closterium]
MHHTPSTNNVLYSAPSIRDLPMRMPRRRASRSSLSSLANCSSSSQRQSEHAACAAQSSPESSSKCLDSCLKELLFSDFRLQNKKEVSISSVSTAATVATEDDEDNQRVVRFAPVTLTASIMCLQNYTPTEVEACWYTRSELDHLRHKTSRKLRRRSFCPQHPAPLNKEEDRRWSA